MARFLERAAAVELLGSQAAAGSGIRESAKPVFKAGRATLGRAFRGEKFEGSVDSEVLASKDREMRRAAILGNKGKFLGFIPSDFILFANFLRLNPPEGCSWDS